VPERAVSALRSGYEAYGPAGGMRRGASARAQQQQQQQQQLQLQQRGGK
jgi:hypothetical protein